MRRRREAARQRVERVIFRRKKGARNDTLCAALISVDVAHAAHLSFIIVPNLLLTPYPLNSCPYFWESVF